MTVGRAGEAHEGRTRHLHLGRSTAGLLRGAESMFSGVAVGRSCGVRGEDDTPGVLFRSCPHSRCAAVNNEKRTDFADVDALAGHPASALQVLRQPEDVLSWRRFARTIGIPRSLSLRIVAMVLAASC